MGGKKQHEAIDCLFSWMIHKRTLFQSIWSRLLCPGFNILSKENRCRLQTQKRERMFGNLREYQKINHEQYGFHGTLFNLLRWTLTVTNRGTFHVLLCHPPRILDKVQQTRWETTIEDKAIQSKITENIEATPTTARCPRLVPRLTSRLEAKSMEKRRKFIADQDHRRDRHLTESAACT